MIVDLQTKNHHIKIYLQWINLMTFKLSNKILNKIKKNCDFGIMCSSKKHVVNMCRLIIAMIVKKTSNSIGLIRDPYSETQTWPTSILQLFDSLDCNFVDGQGGWNDWLEKKDPETGKTSHELKSALYTDYRWEHSMLDTICCCGYEVRLLG